MIARLNSTTIRDVLGCVTRPDYDRAGLRAGIVHFGIGAFHRAHQAVFTEDAIGVFLAVPA
jgi:Mannitol dehydrogenase Rossmann domain